MLFDFIFRGREGFGIVDQYSQLNIVRFRVTISVKDFQVTANCPKGRVFAIDSQEQWNAAISKVITKEQELIDRFPRSGLSFLFMIIHYPGSQRGGPWSPGALKFLLWSPEPYHFTDWSPDPFLAVEPGAQRHFALSPEPSIFKFACAC